MINGKVKTKVHDPPNLILGVDIRCLTKKMLLHSHITFWTFGIFGQLEHSVLKGRGVKKVVFREKLAYWGTHWG